ncbi:MAG: DUF5640 domain-containing protein [Clostridia bacterium]|nr:DUF5640 domain-containing protein [Clostridia bacterium]
MKKINKIVCVACAFVLMISLAACGKKNIVGKWSCKQNDAVTVYEFNEDGTGNMDLGEGIVIPINYSLDNDKLKISYTYLGTDNNIEYNVLIEKKTLTLNNASSNLTLEKQ